MSLYNMPSICGQYHLHTSCTRPPTHWMLLIENQAFLRKTPGLRDPAPSILHHYHNTHQQKNPYHVCSTCPLLFLKSKVTCYCPISFVFLVLQRNHTADVKLGNPPPQHSTAHHTHTTPHCTLHTTHRTPQHQRSEIYHPWTWRSMQSSGLIATDGSHLYEISQSPFKTLLE